MSRHVSYRGATIDMESLRRDNEKSVALGNMKVNARGDQIDRGKITKTAEQIARENHRIQSAIVSSSIKGPAPEEALPEPIVSKKTSIKKSTEVELPSGDIVVKPGK